MRILRHFRIFPQPTGFIHTVGMGLTANIQSLHEPSKIATDYIRKKKFICNAKNDCILILHELFLTNDLNCINDSTSDKHDLHETLYSSTHITSFLHFHSARNFMYA